MSPTSDSKRNSRKVKKKRTVQTKENQPPKNTVSSEKSETMTKPSLDTSVSLSQVVNRGSFTPFLDGERCILCHQERPVITRKGIPSKEDAIQGSQQKVDKLPLWVCPECRRKVEEDERRSGMDTASINNDVLFQSPPSEVNSFLPEDLPEKDLCNCHVCAGKRHLVPAKTKELQELLVCEALKFSWFEVKHFVRCVYRETGTTLADDDKLMSGSIDKDRMKRHSERLISTDPHQLYERLEAQAKEYLAEVRTGLIKFLSSTFTNSPQHAKDCVTTLLDEYQSLCVATDILKPFLAKLESSYLNKFEMTWELMNKKHFCQEIFNDPTIQSSLPKLLSQLRSGLSISSCGVPVPDKCVQDAQSNLVARFENFSLEMVAINAQWQKVKLLRDKYVNEKNLDERGKYTSENWDSPLEKEKEDKSKDFIACDHCGMSSNPLPPCNHLSDLSCSLSSKRSCSSPICSSSSSYCSRHSQHSSSDSDSGNLSSSQLLPTALFLNRLTNSKCASCIREALHSFCFDQKNAKLCRHHEGLQEKDKTPPNPVCSCEPFDLPSCHGFPDHHECAFQQNSSSPPSPETACSIQSLLLNGSPGLDKCRSVLCKNHGGCAAKEWDDDDVGAREDGCEGHEHRGATSPSIAIPGNNVHLEAPPSSPSSVRSNGDGSSCDTPTSRSSLSEDGRPNNGKYCDCCYCEFFGHGAPPVAQTSHNFVEMREKLRLRLKEKEKEKKPMDFAEHAKTHNCVTDSRTVDELLTFINGNTEEKPVESNKNSSKAAKRQRQKLKKAAEKGNHIMEADDKAFCSLIPKMKDAEEKQPTIFEEKPKKNLKQKKFGKMQASFSETQRQNAKNAEKTHNCDVKGDAVTQPGVTHHETKQNEFYEKPKSSVDKQVNTSQNGGSMDRRRKKKDKQCAANESRASGNGQERCVIVNGSVVQQVGRHVENTRGARLTVREEAEPRSFEIGCSGPEEKPSDSQGKKAKGRKKKKNGDLDDVFLPKENITNCHPGEVDEAEREVEEFKRFCASVAPVSRKLKLPASLNLKNLNLGTKKS